MNCSPSPLKISEKRVSVLRSFQQVTYSPITMFLHRKPTEAAVYRHLHTANGNSLKLTYYHLIYATNCRRGERLRLVPAKTLRVGQCVYAIGGDQAPPRLRASAIVRITERKEYGIYAPLTASGDIIVNGVLASCHSNLAAQTLQQTFFVWWRTLDRWTNGVYKYFVAIVGAGGNDDDALTTPDDDAYRPNAGGELPFGVEYLTSAEILEIFVPLIAK